jgi:hypothetical protein
MWYAFWPLNAAVEKGRAKGYEESDLLPDRRAINWKGKGGKGRHVIRNAGPCPNCGKMQDGCGIK